MIAVYGNSMTWPFQEKEQNVKKDFMENQVESIRRKISLLTLTSDSFRSNRFSPRLKKLRQCTSVPVVSDKHNRAFKPYTIRSPFRNITTAASLEFIHEKAPKPKYATWKKQIAFNQSPKKVIFSAKVQVKYIDTDIEEIEDLATEDGHKPRPEAKALKNREIEQK